MYKRSLSILVISFLFAIFSCKENIVENEQPSISDVKILHPNGGEILFAGETDTIRWSYPETIESLGLYYTLDNGTNWKTLTYNEKIPSGRFIWTIPEQSSNDAKIKLLAISGNKYIIESDSVFQISRRIDIITPNTLTGLDIDTLQFIPHYRYNSLEFYYAIRAIDDNSTNYELWNRVRWIKIESNLTFPDSMLIWRVPNKSGPYKIKAISVFDEKEMTFYSDEFQIDGVNGTILFPNNNEVFSYPQNITIKWDFLQRIPDEIEIYYSKFGTDASVIDSWILVNDNIDPNTNEYIWTLPSMYSNQVSLKVVGTYSDSSKIVGISNTNFAIHNDNVLEEEREYQEKFAIGNKWVYQVTKRAWLLSAEEYYNITKEVIDSKVENGIKYYEVLEKTIKDSISFSSSWVIDRENYSPSYVMQDGDSYTERSWRYYYASCKEYYDVILSNQQKIKEYFWEVSESGTANSTHKRVKDIGIFYYYYYSEGSLLQKDLVGVYVDGVLMGDTTTVQ